MNIYIYKYMRQSVLRGTRRLIRFRRSVAHSMFTGPKPLSICFMYKHIYHLLHNQQFTQLLPHWGLWWCTITSYSESIISIELNESHPWCVWWHDNNNNTSRARHHMKEKPLEDKLLGGLALAREKKTMEA